MRRRRTTVTALLIVLPVLALFCVTLRADDGARSATITDSWELGPTWSGCPLGAQMLTTRGWQYVAYYDAERRMTVASRKLGADEWRTVTLPSRASWDSHLGFALAVDENGLVHLSGNMHCEPLVYFRTAEPFDITTFEPVHRMVGRQEESVTYEQFFRGPNGRLIFWYRTGSSGSGARIFNVWDPDEKSWSRLFDQPLFDGLGRMNAYPLGPKKGPEGNYHIVWMWRNTPDAATNHHISYVWTPDMEQWRTAGGRALELPITPETEGVVVDPVPPREGLINMGFSLGFDAHQRPVVSYHKYDEDGNSQIFNARWEGSEWQVYRTSEWDYRWNFGGGGSIPCEVRAGPVTPLPGGNLCQSYSHSEYGGGRWELDSDSLQPVGSCPREGFSIPGRIRGVRSDFPRMQVHLVGDGGDGAEQGVRYYLRWESLPRNRDRPREGPLPDPSPLTVYRLEETR